MFTLRKSTRRIFGVRYFYRERKFPWSPYLKDKVYKHPRVIEDDSGPAEYPEIEDLSPQAAEKRRRQRYYDKIQKLGTVEEKLIALNLAKYYGWPAFHLNESTIPYDYLPFAQYITRTVISEESVLPLTRDAEHIKPLLSILKTELERVITFERCGLRYKNEVETEFIEEEKQKYLSPLDMEVIKTKHLVKQINSVIMRTLVSQFPHLLSVQVDYDPRIEAFWRVGGFFITDEDRKLREAKKVHKNMRELPIDRFFQYYGSPILQLRSKLPLPLLKKLNWTVPVENGVAETNSIETSFEKSVTSHSAKEKEVSEMATKNNSRIYPLHSYKYRPDVYLQIPRKRVHGAVIPGFWPNDPHRFGILSYHSSNSITKRPDYWGESEHQEALHAQALIACFAFTYGQACYQGFSTYNDVTYPFVSQSILTDGHRFSFYSYQLNTIVLHTDNNENANPIYNACYATPAQELYHAVENGKVIGWNEKALVNLLALYMNIPAVRESIDLCPYLEKEEKLTSLIENKKKRIFLHDKHRYLSANRFCRSTTRRFNEEIYDWERIFKIDHQIRQTDARKRHFEKFEDWVNDRKLNEHYPRYIPKKFREPGRAHMDKFEDTFYPDAYPDYHEIV